MKPRKKVNRQVKNEKTEASKGASAAEAKVTEPTPSKPKKIKVLKPDAKYRGAREAWLARLKEYDGKPLDDFVANTTEKPPAVPKSGTKEKPSGWVRFFERQGVLSIQQ